MYGRGACAALIVNEHAAQTVLLSSVTKQSIIIIIIIILFQMFQINTRKLQIELFKVNVRNCKTESDKWFISQIQEIVKERMRDQELRSYQKKNLRNKGMFM